MFRSASLALALAFSQGAWCADAYPGIGRAATAQEIAAWDIDVRPDLKGLPKGSGSVRKGEEVWEGKCASCHGAFGESNAYFPPIAGGVTKDDVARGRAAALTRPEQRTTMMKLSRVSTLWDYINRAMPWNAPKTLTTEEVYAVTAYILSLDRIVPDDFVLSDANMAEVQARLPNRDGLTREHGLWDVRGKPDVRAKACMKNCAAEPKVTSRLPEDALGNHGNLAAQHRLVGPVRGVHVAALAEKARDGEAIAELAKKTGCLACHGATARMVGPSLAEIAKKYRNDALAEGRLTAKVRDGGQGVWGEVPMPPHKQLAEGELRSLVRWILTAQ